MDAQEPSQTGQPAAARRGDPDITGMLAAWRAGDRTAVDRLFPAVYDELRRIAHRQLGRERGPTRRESPL